jgi:UPF0755 protein
MFRDLLSHLNNLREKTIALIDRFEGRLMQSPRIVKLRLSSERVHPLLGNYFFNIAYILFIVVVLLSLHALAWRAPRPFPDHILVTIEKGEHLSQIAEKFDKEKVVRSSISLRILVGIRGGEHNVIAGDYYFPNAVSVFDVARTITAGEYGLSPIRVVFPEGLNSSEMADILAEALPRFDKESFIDEAKKSEGYLFPDTYFFMPNASSEDMIGIMRENFARQVNDYKPDIEKFGKPLEDVVIMASIVENEARLLDTRRVVAGILWKRLKLDMPLQSDVTFKYSVGKTTFDLTKEDLENKDDPYNTYANKGLPPTPISNPGIDSIRATIAPTNTQYLFFLSDANGTMHYAADFEGHKRNRELYLH